MKIATKIRETCEKTLRFCLSNKRLPKIASVCLAIGCCKIASERLGIRYSQFTSDYSVIQNCQITIAYLAKKERQIAKSI
jgi:hypothetical protein